MKRFGPVLAITVMLMLGSASQAAATIHPLMVG